MKKLRIAAIALLMAAGMVMAMHAAAQAPAARQTVVRTGTVNGSVVDGVTVAGLAGANVEFRSMADTTVVKRAAAAPNGSFSVHDLTYGEWRIEVSYVGYEIYNNKLTVNSRNMTVAPFFMNQSANDIGEVAVTAQAVRVSMHGDTIVYNAHAFKAADDADAEAILKQLPGVEVQDGAVKVQGKSVSKILVDGKETYGGQVDETMKTIPANMLDKIEVYDKLSDFAETTGISDGDDYTVMNFVTGIKFAHFGDFSALWGWKDWYAASARYNMVTGSHRFMVNGGANNTGGDAMSDGDGVIAGMFGGGGYHAMYAAGGDGGSRSTNNKAKNISSGMSWNYEPSDKFRLNTTYRYGRSDDETHGNQETHYFNNQLYDKEFNERGSTSGSNRHRFEGNARWKINARQNVNMRFSGSVTDQTSTNHSERKYFEDGIEDMVQYFLNDTRSGSDNYNISAQVNYGLKIDGHGRSVRVGINGRVNKGDGDSWADSRTIRNLTDVRQLDSLGRSRSYDNSGGHSAQGRVEYFEPLSNYLRATMVYETSYNYSDNDRNSERWDYDYTYGDPAWQAAFDAGHWAEWEQGSNVMSSETWSHRVGPGLNYSKNNDRLRLNVVYKYTLMEGRRKLPLPAYDSRADFNNFVYSAAYEKQITPQTSIDIDFSSDTRNPTLSQLQDVDDISTNGIYVSGGNSELKPYYSYESSANFHKYDLRTSSSFSVGVNGSLTSGSIGTARVLVTEDGTLSPNGTVLEAGQQYSRPINIDKGIWSVGMNASWGRPLKFMKSNFNLGAYANYSENPGTVNGEENISRRQSYNLSLNLNSNFSEKMVIGGGYSFSPSFATNTNTRYANASSNSIGQRANFNFYWRTWKDFVLRADLRYTYSRSKLESYADDIVNDRLTGNVSLGKKLFKNKRGEIIFAVSDLFNQSKVHNQSVEIDRITYTNDTSIGRYFSLSFRYQLRNFSKDAPEGRSGRPVVRDASIPRPPDGFGGRRTEGRMEGRMGGRSMRE